MYRFQTNNNVTIESCSICLFNVSISSHSSQLDGKEARLRLLEISSMQIFLVEYWALFGAAVQANDWKILLYHICRAMNWESMTLWFFSSRNEHLVYSLRCYNDSKIQYCRTVNRLTVWQYLQKQLAVSNIDQRDSPMRFSCTLTDGTVTLLIRSVYNPRICLMRPNDWQLT